MVYDPLSDYPSEGDVCRDSLEASVGTPRHISNGRQAPFPSPSVTLDTTYNDIFLKKLSFEFLSRIFESRSSG